MAVAYLLSDHRQKALEHGIRLQHVISTTRRTNKEAAAWMDTRMDLTLTVNGARRGLYRRLFQITVAGIKPSPLLCWWKAQTGNWLRQDRKVKLTTRSIRVACHQHVGVIHSDDVTNRSKHLGLSV